MILEKLPLLGLAAVFCGITMRAQRGAIASDQILSFLWRFRNAFCSYATYIKQLIFPAGLVPFYPHQGAGLPLRETVASVILLAGISWGVFAGRKKFSYLITGWLWYLGMLVPVIGITQAGLQAHADRYTYLPQIGLMIMATWLTADGCAALRYRRAVLSTVAAAILAVMAVAAHLQTRHWRDSVSLWTHTLAHTTRNFMALYNLSDEFLRQEEFEKAISQLEKILELDPELADIQYNLGNVFAGQGEFEKAIPHLEKALKINPEYAEAHFSLGTLFARQGQFDKAIPHLEKALKINPDDAKGHCNLGNLFISKKNFRAAIQQYDQAIRIRPEDVEVQNNLAWILATGPEAALRDGQRAVELAERADRFSGGNNPSLLNTLAAAYAEAGRFPEAVAAAQRAVSAAVAQGADAERIRERLQLYQAGRPWHEVE